MSLIHYYYATELPLPIDVNSLYRIAGAVTKTERDAVKVVMSFFEKMESGLVHPRIEAELQKAGERSDTNRSIALKREENRRANRNEKNKQRIDQEKSTNRAENVPRSYHETNTELALTRHQTPDTNKTLVNTHHRPSSQDIGEITADSVCLSEPVFQFNTQSPDKNQWESLPNLEPGDERKTAAGQACKAIRELGISDANPGNQKLLELIKAGAELDEFCNAAALAKDRGKGFGYLLGIMIKQRSEAVNLVLHKGKMPNKQEALEQRNRNVANNWQPEEGTNARS